MKRNIIITGSVILILIAGYFLINRKEAPPTTTVVIPADTEVETKPEPRPLPPPPPKPRTETGYSTLTLASTAPQAELAKAVGEEHVEAVLMLNRIDAKHLVQNMTVIIPETFDRDSLSSFPQTIEAAKDIPKLFLVSQKVQAWGAYEFGILVRSGTTSTGKQSTQTPSKLYSLNWKGKLVTSSFSDEWILPWYFNLDNFEGISLHQYEMPGYPASHSCVRLYEADAKWLYDWGEQWILSPDGKERLAHGTPVIIFGTYGYGKTAPWKLLPENKDAITITEEELNELVNTNLETIQERAVQREAVLAAKTI